MQKHFVCLIAIAGILSTVPCSLADPGLRTPKAAIQANYDHIYIAARHKDMSQAVRYFSSDFTAEDLANTRGSKTPLMSLDQLHQMAADYEEGSQSITGHAVIQRLVLCGNQATATVMHHVVYVSTRNPETGKQFHGIFDAITQDTWVQKPQGWLMQTGRGVSLRTGSQN